MPQLALLVSLIALFAGCFGFWHMMGARRYAAQALVMMQEIADNAVVTMPQYWWCAWCEFNRVFRHNGRGWMCMDCGHNAATKPVGTTWAEQTHKASEAALREQARQDQECEGA